MRGGQARRLQGKPRVVNRKARLHPHAFVRCCPPADDKYRIETGQNVEVDVEFSNELTRFLSGENTQI